MFRAQREGSRTVPETGEDRDVYISIAQVAIVACVFFLSLYRDCVCMPVVLLNMFYSVGSVNRAAVTALGVE